MSVKIESDMPYLRAIQQIPGNTPVEKFSWIRRLAARDQEAGGDRDKVPQELQPLLQVESAIKQNTSEYEKDIKSALQSEDSMINRRALKASWFFNGKCKATINAEYFCNHIFPNVSLRTRTSIITTLKYHLIGKDPVFAEKLFTAITSAYDIKTAYPLIVACRESFIYDTIVEKKLILPYTIVKNIYRINSNLVVRYLELLKPNNTDDPFAIDIGNYTPILVKLAKKHLESFIKLCITHEFNLYNIILSKTSAGIFLKKAKNYLITHPKIFFKMLPLKMINADVIEIIFPKLLPDKRYEFSINNALDILKFYLPKEKKIELLLKSYKEKYNAEFLDEPNNVTPAVLRILPAEKRIELARSKIKDQKYNFTMKSYEISWICYYNTKDTIPMLMENIKNSIDPMDRADYIGQMMYCCKVNEDNEMLAEVIKYIIARHKNERSNVCERIMTYFAQIYKDEFFLGEQLQSLVFDMINLFYVKHGLVNKRIIASLTHFRLLNNLPIKDLMEMFVGLNTRTMHISLNILEQYPLFERKCLEVIGDILHDKYSVKQGDKTKTITEQQKHHLIEFIKAIYAFNKRCKKLYPKVKPLTITDYPNLSYIISAILKSVESDYFRGAINNLLKQNEPKFYNNLIPKTENNIENLTFKSNVSELKQLKKNPLDILNNWEEYLQKCKELCFNKNVQKFVRAMRWYQDIPIKFAEHCIKDLNKNDKHNQRSALIILSILLHGDTLTKIIKPFVSDIKETVNVSEPDARNNYLFTEVIPLCIKLSNPPVSFDIITKLSEGDYLSTTLVALTNISRRSSLEKVLLFAQQLISMRVGVRKHGIRLLRLISSMHEYINHLDHFWTTEKNLSIRQILLDLMEQFFMKNPCAETWSLYCKMISTATIEDSEIIFFKMQLNFLMQQKLKIVASDCITQYIALWFSTINRFHKDGMTNDKINNYIGKFVDILWTEPVFEFVPDEIADKIIKNYLFHSENTISLPSRHFALLYIFTKDQDKLQTRKKVLIETIESARLRWNEPHPLKFRFYPVNNTIHNFMIEFADKCVKSRYQQSFKSKIVDDMLEIFKSYLLPVQDIKSYLMLEYTKLLLKCTSEKEEHAFGLRLGLFVPSLVDIFTPLLVHFMAITLDQFLRSAYSTETNDKVTLETARRKIMEGLIHSEHIPSIVLATILLSFEKRSKMYDNLIEKLTAINHPAVITILYNYLNSENFMDIDWDK